MYKYRNLTPEQKEHIVKQRLACGYPAHAPPHPIRNQKFYLLTAACYEHKPHLQPEPRRQQTLTTLFDRFAEAEQKICAWVILPNHYHLLVRVTNFDRLSNIFRLTHGSLSYRWNLEEKIKGRKVWYRYTDRAIRSERHYYTTLNYIHYNPVKHNYVQSPYDWPQSSVHWYLDHYGREWLQDLWVKYSLQSYGEGWDD